MQPFMRPRKPLRPPSASARPTRLEQPQCNYTRLRSTLTMRGCDQHLTSCRCADARRAILQLQSCSASLARNPPPSFPDLAYRGLLCKASHLSRRILPRRNLFAVSPLPSAVAAGCMHLCVSADGALHHILLSGENSPLGAQTGLQNRIRWSNTMQGGKCGRVWLLNSLKECLVYVASRLLPSVAPRDVAETPLYKSIKQALPSKAIGNNAISLRIP